MSSSEEVLKKAIRILERELSSRELLEFLQIVTPKTGDSVRELEEKTRNMKFDEVLKLIKKVERT